MPSNRSNYQRNRERDQNRGPGLREIFEKFKRKDIEGYKSAVEELNRYVESRMGKVTTSQLRNVFNRVMKEKGALGLQRVRPLLAYLAGRNKNAKNFLDSLDRIVREINTDEGVNEFKKFLEAIICYKRYYE